MPNPKLIADRLKANELMAFVTDLYGEMGEHGKKIFRKEISEFLGLSQPLPPEKPAEPEPRLYGALVETDEQIDSIRELANEVIESCHSDKGIQFAEDVLETALGIGGTIEATGIVTVNQQRALDNIQDALRNWIRD